MKKLLILLFSLAMLAGCSAKLAEGPMFQQASMEEPDPAMTTVYFYRGSDVYGIQSLETIPVLADGKEIGLLYRGGYFTWKAKAGKYELFTDVKGTILDNILEIELEENKTYFIRSVFRSVFLSNVNSLVVIPEQQAIDELKDFRHTTN